MKLSIRFFLTTFVCLFASLLYATPVSESEALQQAQAFLAERGRLCSLETPAQAPGMGRPHTDTPAPYHIFNVVDNGGFVIVSGDDRAQAVLGYADEGFIDMNNMPEGLRDLLDGYAEEIAHITSQNPVEPQEQPAQAPARSIQLMRRPIPPLIHTLWNQDGEFWLNTPTVQTASGVQHTYTGCVATNMAQLMYYHHWPNATTKPIPGYFCEQLNRQLDTLPVTTFDYDSMLLEYDANSDSAAILAVSKLMQYAGWAIHTDYGINGSPSYTFYMPDAMIQYFDYDSSALYQNRYYYTYNEWIDLLYNELANRRPVPYTAKNTDFGHSIICDGYDMDDFFHFNFGWSGECNGYYRVSSLNPILHTIGEPMFNDGGLTNYHGAVIGIQPNTGETSRYAPLELNYLWLKDNDNHLRSHTQVYYRDSIEQGFTDIEVFLQIHNLRQDTMVFDYLMEVIENETGERVDTLFCKEENPDILNPDTIQAWLFTCELKNLTPGSYLMRFKTRVHGTEEWKDAVFSNVNYFTAEVDSLTLTMHVPHIIFGTVELIDITSTGPHMVGLQDTVFVRIAATDGDFKSSTLWLTKIENNRPCNISSQQAHVLMGDTATVMFCYIPSKADIDTLIVLDDYYNLIRPVDSIQPYFATGPIADNPELPCELSLPLECSVQITNLVDNTLYGNSLDALVSVVNLSPDTAMYAFIYCDIYKWSRDSTGNWNRILVTYFRNTPTIPKQIGEVPDTIVVPLFLYGFAPHPDSLYSFRFSYYRQIDNQWIEIDIAHIGMEDDHGVIRINGGYVMADALANGILRPQSDTIRCEDACYVDMRTTELNGVTVIPSTNPNCIYRLNPYVPVPAELTGLNVMVGDTADSIIIHDAYDFRFPVRSVFANYARFSRHVDISMPNDSWNIFMLPFTPTNINANIRFYAPDYDEPGIIHLREEFSLEPYSLYFYKLPNDSTNPLTDLTFSATNSLIEGTPGEFKWEGELYTVCTTSRTIEMEDAMIPSGRNMFIKQPSVVTIEPFCGWITGTTMFANTLGYVVIDEGIITSMEEVPAVTIGDAPEDNAWYTLTGIRLDCRPAHPGAYIHNHQVEIIR